MEQEQDRRLEEYTADISEPLPSPEDTVFTGNETPANAPSLQDADEQLCATSSPATLDYVENSVDYNTKCEVTPQNNMSPTMDPYVQSQGDQWQNYHIPPNPYTQGSSYPPQNHFAQYNPYAQQDPYTPSGRYSRVPTIAQQESKNGIVALICGLLSMTLSYFVPAISLPLGIVAIVLGVSKIKEAKRIGRGMTGGVLGLVFGIMGTVATVALTTWLLVRFFRALEGLSQLGEHRPM